MRDRLDDILDKIAEEYKEYISRGSRNYLEVNLGKQAEKMGFPDEKIKYSEINVVVPLRGPMRGMKVRIDGRTFVNYAEFDSGIAAPGHLTSSSGMPHKVFIPNDSMILNFT
jgi:hypothetical protein